MPVVVKFLYVGEGNQALQTHIDAPPRQVSMLLHILALADPVSWRKQVP
jgi:hypothetical protein